VVIRTGVIRTAGVLEVEVQVMEGVFPVVEIRVMELVEEKIKIIAIKVEAMIPVHMMIRVVENLSSDATLLQKYIVDIVA
jgi:hypothetical protein